MERPSMASRISFVAAVSPLLDAPERVLLRLQTLRRAASPALAGYYWEVPRLNDPKVTVRDRLLLSA